MYNTHIFGKKAKLIMNKFLKTWTAVLVGAGFFSAMAPAEAGHSSMSGMSPRNTIKVDKDYAYGYSYLPGDALDVYQTANRDVGWTVNYEFLDKNFLRPVSVVYVNWVPQVVRDCTYNFHQNLREVNNTVNNLLVARPLDSGISASRLAINTTIGVAGCFDVAGAWGLERRRMTFSTVLGKWGVEQGGYIVFPGYGIATYRSLIGSTVDIAYFPFNYFPIWLDAIFWVSNGLESRSRLLKTDEVVANSLDPYIQTRDFYLMYEQSLVSGKTEGKTQDSATEKTNSDEMLNDYLDEIDE